jgi:hypothetical protein
MMGALAGERGVLRWRIAGAGSAWLALKDF